MANAVDINLAVVLAVVVAVVVVVIVVVVVVVIVVVAAAVVAAAVVVAVVGAAALAASVLGETAVLVVHVASVMDLEAPACSKKDLSWTFPQLSHLWVSSMQAKPLEK